MGSARYSAGGAEAFLDGLVGAEPTEVPADGPGPEATPKPERVARPRRDPPKAPETPEEDAQAIEAEREAEEPAEAAPAPRAPEEVELNHRGNSVRVTQDRLRNLAQKGFDYESRMKELKDHEAELRTDAEGWKAYQEYRTWMKENRPAAQAVANLLEFFESKGRVPKMDLEGEGEEGTEKMPASIARALARVDERFAALDKREREAAVQNIATEMLAAVRSQPVLKRLSDADRKANRSDRALKKLAAAMKTDPAAGLEELAEQVATEIQADVETLNPATRTYVDEKQKDRERFGRPERPGAAAPEIPVPEAKEYSAKDLKNGNVRRGVAAFLATLAPN